MNFMVTSQRLAIINNVPVGRRRRREAEVWPLDIQLLEAKMRALSGKNPEEDWADVGGELPEGHRSPHEDTLLASFDTNQSSKKYKPESQADSHSLLGGLVKQMIRWVREDNLHSSEKTEGRSVEYKEEEEEDEDESCLVSTWRCMSTVLEQGVTCFQRPRAFQR